MLKIDEKYLLLVFFCPGVVFFYLIHWWWQTFVPLVDSDRFIAQLFSLQTGVPLALAAATVAALLLGVLLWFIHEKILGKQILKWRMRFINKQLLRQPILEYDKSIDELNEKFKTDFDKAFYTMEERGNELQQKENFDEIYFTFQRSVGVEIPTALRYLREMLQLIGCGLLLVSLLHLLAMIYALVQTMFLPEWVINEQTTAFAFFFRFVVCIAVTLFAYRVLFQLDKRYFRTLLNLYLSPQYTNIVEKIKSNG